MYQRNKRRCQGQAISEFGPAVFLLLVVTFFPFMVLIGIGFSFGSSWYLNNLLCKELSVNPQASEAAIIRNVNNAFGQSGIARFLGIDNVDDRDQIDHTVVYRAATAEGDPATVLVTSVIKTRPPLLSGFNEGRRYSFRSSTEKMREVVD